MRKAIRRMQAVFLAVLMLLSSVPAVLAAETEPELPEYTAQLYQGSYDKNNSEQNKVVSGMELSQDAELYYVITKEHMVPSEGEAVQEEVTYRIPLPEPLVCRTTLTQTIVAEYSNIEGIAKTLSIGTFSMTKDASFLTVCFDIPKGDDNPDGVTLEWVNNFHLSFGCKMDETMLEKKVDDEGKLTITLPGGENLELIISEFKPVEPVAPVIAKSNSSMTQQGETTWTITYTPGNETYTGEVPTRLVDTLPQGLQLVEDSITITPQDGASLVTVPDGTQDEDTPASPLTFSIDGDKAVTISYQTTLAPEKWLEIFGTNGTWKGSFTNSVQGYVQNSDSSEWIAWQAPATATVQGSISNTFLNKTSSDINYDGDTKTYSVTWTISVRPQGQVFDTLVLTDKMGAKLIVPNDLSQLNMAIKYPGEHPDGAPIIILDHLEKLEDGTLKITFDQETLKKIAGKDFKLTYTTQVDSTALQDPAVDLTQFGNEIQAQGESGGQYFTTPVISFTPENAKQVLITHDGVAVDTTTRTLTWETTINPLRGTLPSPNLTQVLYRNVLPKTAWHSFGWTEEMRQEVKEQVESSIKAALEKEGLPETALKRVEVKDEGDCWVLEVALEGTGEKEITFQYHTHAQDPTVWAANKEPTYEYSNTVYLAGTKTVIDNTPLQENAFATGKQEVPGGNALRKWPMNAYDPASQTLTWELMINERGANLGDIQIEEMLPAGMEYVPGSAKIGFDTNNNQLSQSLTDDQVVVSAEDNKVTFLLNEVTKFCRIQFDVKVDVEKLTQEKNSFKNTAKLYVQNDADGGKLVNTATASETATIVNKLLTKTAEKPVVGSDDSRAVTYTVKLNPLGMDLTQLVENAQDGVFLVDTMDEGLVVDLDSVKLYEGVVGAAAKPDGMTHWYTPEVKQGAEVNEPEISFDSWTNQLRIRIPDPQKAYYLTYTAYVVKPNVTLNNHIELEGSTAQFGGGSFGASNAKVEVEFSVGMTLRPPTAKYISIPVEKIDGNTQQKLANAEYGLYTEKNKESSLVARGETDQNGMCVLSVPKKALGGKATLYIKELAAPDGYLVDRTWHEVTIDPSGNQPVVILENQRETEENNGRIEVTVEIKSEEPPDPWEVTNFPFLLYVKPEDGETMGSPVFKDPVYPDRDGNLVVDGLDPDKEYVLVPDEKQFPDRYIPPDPQPVTPSENPEEPVDVTVQEKEKDTDPDGGDPDGGGEKPDGGNPDGGGEEPDGGGTGGGSTGGGSTGGGSTDGGDSDGGAEKPDSGDPDGGGEEPDGGDSDGGGEEPDGGDSDGGTEKPDSGDPDDSGEKPDGGDPDDSGEKPDGGDPDDGGEEPDGGSSDGDGEESDSGSPSGGDEPEDNAISNQTSGSESSIPKTGEHNRKALWLTGFVLSLTAACLLLGTGKKGKGTRNKH